MGHGRSIWGKRVLPLLAKAANKEQMAHVGNQTGGRVTFFLFTDDCRRDFKKLKDRGVQFERPITEFEYGTVAVFADLYGNLWDLIEPNEKNKGWIRNEALDDSGKWVYALRSELVMPMTTRLYLGPIYLILYVLFCVGASPNTIRAQELSPSYEHVIDYNEDQIADTLRFYSPMYDADWIEFYDSHSASWYTIGGRGYYNPFKSEFLEIIPLPAALTIARQASLVDTLCSYLLLDSGPARQLTRYACRSV